MVDAKRAGPLLGLLPVELVLKAHYPIPEIWLRRDDPASAERAATELRQAGMSVRIAAGTQLSSIPPQAMAETFAFGDDGLTLALEEEDVIIPYDLPLIVVACSPRDPGDESRAPGDRGSAALRALPDAEGSGAWGVFADLYADVQGRLMRYGVNANQTDFAALGGGMAMAGPAGKLTRFLSECEGRFSRMTIDRRLLHLQPRRKHAPPPAGAPQRKGFAFGTPALANLLNEIAPATPDLNQCELSSRLVYLTQR